MANFATGALNDNYQRWMQYDEDQLQNGTGSAITNTLNISASVVNISESLNVAGNTSFGDSNTELHEFTGSVDISGSLTVATDTTASFGFITKTGGSFKIPYPGQETEYDLYHSFVESPTSGDNIYRYEVEAKKDKDNVKIELPDYFDVLNENVQIWVTAQDHFGNAFGKIYKNSCIVRCELKGKYNVLIIGTRKDPDAKNFWAAGVKREK